MLFRSADLRGAAVGRYCSPEADGRALIRTAVDRLGLSARGYDRVLKVARTIADLHLVERVTAEHIGEALQYHLLD